MPANVAELGIRIDANGAVTTVKQLGGELDRLATAGDKVSRTTKAQEQELRKLAEISRSLGDIQGKQFQTLIRLNGGQEKFLQIQRQIDEELRVADQVAKQYEQTTQQVVKAKDGATAASNRLRSGFATLASQVAGTNPVVGQLASTIAGFAVGGVVTVGVLAGLAAIGIAYNKLTEDTRKAREEQDKFVESLAKARREELRSSPQGRQLDVEQAEKALRQRQQELRNLQLAGPAATADIAGGANFGADPVAKQKAIAEATDAVRQAEIELSRAKVEQSKAYIAADNAIQQALEGGDAILKGIDERRKKEQNEELSRLKAKLDLLLKLNGLPDLSALTANIDARIQSNPIPDYLAGKTGAQTGVSKEEAKRQEDRSRADLEWERANAQRILAEGKAEKSISKLDRAAQIAGQALEYYIVSKVGGGTAAGALGGAVGKAVYQDSGLSKAIGGSALGGLVFGSLFTGFGSAIGKAVDDLFGISGASKRLREEMEKLKESVARSVDVEKAKLGLGGNVGQIEAENTVREYYGRLREDTEKAFHIRRRLPVTDQASREWNELREKEIAAKKKHLEEIDTLEQLALEQAKKYVAATQGFDREDLEVRYLRAKGKDKEADELALKIRQEREILEAERQGRDKEYIARLKEIQAIEKTTDTLDELAKSSLNLVQGYRYQSTVFKNAPINPFGPEIQGGWEGTPPVQPKSFPQQNGSEIEGGTTQPVYLYIDGEKVGEAVLSTFKKKSQRKFGTTQRWSEIQ